MNNLFRAQAIEEKQVRWTGEAINIRPVSVWVPVLFLTTIVAGLALFLLFGSYSKKERVNGVIVPAEGVLEFLEVHFPIVDVNVKPTESESVPAAMENHCFVKKCMRHPPEKH